MDSFIFSFLKEYALKVECQEYESNYKTVNTIGIEKNFQL